MQLLSDKRFVIVSGILIIILGIWWFKKPSDQISQEDLLSRVQRGYTQQFCNVIFPRIANCVTANAERCPNLVAKHLDGCLLQLKLDLPSSVGNEEGKAIYEKIGACFEKGIHDDLVKNYMINTDECRLKLS